MSSRQTAWAVPPPRFAFHDDAVAGATALDLPARSTWPANLIVAAVFVIFAVVDWSVARTIDLSVGDVFDPAVLLFRALWVAGWSVGVLALGGLTVLLCFYSESAWLAPGRLLLVPRTRLGPLRILLAYDLRRVRNLRLEPAAAAGVRLWFDYAGRRTTLGSPLPRARAEELLNAIQAASAGLSVVTPADDGVAEALAPRATPRDSRPPRKRGGDRFAHLAIRCGARAGQRDSACRRAVLPLGCGERDGVVLAGRFFASHFGAFMAMHVLFIYLLFVRGMHPSGPEPGVRDALVGCSGRSGRRSPYSSSATASRSCRTFWESGNMRRRRSPV